MPFASDHIEQLRIPGGAVVQRIRWYSADYIIGPEAIRQVRRQALPLRVCAVVGSVGGYKDALDRAGKSVVATQVQLRHQRGEGIVLNCRAQWDTRVHRGLITSPNGGKFGSSGFSINCPIVLRLD
jgi:hypothetical protein